MHQVFLSYSRNDSFAAHAVQGFLESRGLSVWKDEARIRAGSSFDRSIREAIRDSAFVLVLCSEAWRESDYCRLELQWALELRAMRYPLTIVPLTLDATPVPGALESMHVLRLADLSEESLTSLLSAVNREHLRVLWSNDFVRITALRHGDEFSERKNPAAAFVGIGEGIVFAFLFNSVGERGLAGAGTARLCTIARAFVGAFPQVLKTLAHERPGERVGVDRIFETFFKYCNNIYRSEFLDHLKDPGLVYSDVTVVLLTEGQIFMRNAGCSNGVVFTPVGHNAGKEHYAIRLLTGNVPGALHLGDGAFGPHFAYPVGRYSEVLSAEPLHMPFRRQGCCAVLTSFPLRERDLESIGMAGATSGGAAIARQLLAATNRHRSLWHPLNAFALIVESLGISDKYGDRARELVASGSGLNASPSTSEGERRARHGRSLMNQRNWVEATRALSEAACKLEEDGQPQHMTADVLSDAGYCAHQAGKLELAVVSFTKAANAFASAGDAAREGVALYRLGCVLMAADAPHDARDRFERALDRAERHRDMDLQVMVLSSRGVLFRRQGDFQAALNDFTRALSMSRSEGTWETPTLLNNLGMCHSSMGDHERAYDCFRDAAERLEHCEHVPAYANSLANGAWELHFRLGRTQEALVQMRRALELLRAGEHRATSSGTSLIQLQCWVDEMLGMDRSAETIQAITEAVSAWVCEPQSQEEQLATSSELLLTDLAETVLEVQVFDPNSPVAAHAWSALERLRTVRKRSD